ncbi:MAG: replicative DNA helicase, partial [Proteobacteria bacterium]|nr:replicative DNA helicase [Pseudomonadota bacterium]
MDQRPFPETVSAERALLGGLIHDPTKLDEIGEVLSPDDFYRYEHQKLFELLLLMHGRHILIDAVTVPDHVRREGKADVFGGVAYVVSLPDHAPSTANLIHYANLVKEKALLRSLIATSQELTSRAYEEPEDVSALLDDGARQLFKLGQRQDRRSWQQISVIMDEEIPRIEERNNSDGDITGNRTGFYDLDAKLAGLQPTDLIILAARPGMGKTALGLNIAQNLAVMDKMAVGIFSLEMGRHQLATRMMCSYAEVNGDHVRRGRLEPDEFERILDASDELREARVFIDDSPALSILDLKARSKRLKAQAKDLKLIVIDYLQLMRGDDPRAPRQQQIAEISRGLKMIAKDLDLTVIALSQLNRAVETRQDKRPQMADLRESGAIEQDADVILFIYRDEIYNEDSEDRGLAELIIAKQRNGPTGTIKLVFRG